MEKPKIFAMSFASVYPLYVQKAEKKINFEEFFEHAPQLNEHASLIRGSICGYRVEEIEDKLMQKILRKPAP